MKRRILSVCCTLALVVGMLFVPEQKVVATDALILDGSYLTHEEESIGYDTKITRGEDLQIGYSKCVKLGVDKIYAGGTTLADHEVESVRLGVIVEYAQEGDDHWTYLDSWQVEANNTDRVMSNRRMEVESGYYYRVRCFHSANNDQSSSFTDGIYIGE